MRKLSQKFLSDLKTGFLAGILDAVKADHDLSLEIRNGYFNIYFKGNSLLKLSSTSSNRYRVDIHEKFSAGLELPAQLDNSTTTAKFLVSIPQLKQNIVKHGKSSLEIEYEQMISRANNLERRNNSDYFIVDRQYTIHGGRTDLLGIYWARDHRRKNQKVDLCLFEIKFALNPDIRDVHRQINDYYETIRPYAAQIADECETVFRQKLDLGLFDKPPKRLDAMKTLIISRDISSFQFIIFLVDYNPNSNLFDERKIPQLHFANQIKIFKGGFALWRQNFN